MRRITVKHVLRLSICVLWLTTAAVAAPNTPRATALSDDVSQRSVWALETFIELANAAGERFHAELRHHCCHTIAATTTRFCDDFKVPTHDCVRLEQFIRQQSMTPPSCDSATATNTIESDPYSVLIPSVAKRLGTFTLSVRHTDENRTQTIKLAIHVGDFIVLDERVDSICGQFELDTTVCGNLRTKLTEMTLQMEMKEAKEQTLHPGTQERGLQSIDGIIQTLLQQQRDLQLQLEEKAQAYAVLTLQTMRDQHKLERRVRELETQLSQQARPTSTDTSVATTTVDPQAQFSTASVRIPRFHVSNLSYAQYQDHARSSTPFIVQGLADLPGSPGLPNWSLQHLNAACGDAIVTLKQAVTNSSSMAPRSAAMWAGIQTVTTAPLSDFLRDFTVSRVSQRQTWPAGYADLYLHDTSLSRFCPKLLAEFTVPRYFTDDKLQGLSRFKQKDYWPSLFIGDESTSSALHTDWANSAAWMGLLHGRKHWAIAKPSAKAALMEAIPTEHTPTAGRFNASLLDGIGRMGGLMRPGEVFEDILEAGEVIFIPADCPHQVNNLGQTIAVAANYVDSANLQGFKHSLTVGKHVSSGEEYRSHVRLLRELEDHESTTQQQLQPQPADLSFAQFKKRFDEIATNRSPF